MHDLIVDILEKKYNVDPAKINEAVFTCSISIEEHCIDVLLASELGLITRATKEMVCVVMHWLAGDSCDPQLMTLAVKAVTELARQ